MKRDKFILSAILFCSAFLVLILTHPRHAISQEKQPQSIAVLLFEVHAAKDLSHLKDGIRNMLASRIAANAGVNIIEKDRVDSLFSKQNGIKSDAGLRDLGSKLNADYIIAGSITRLGSALSIDVKVVDAKEKNNLQNFYVTASDEDKVIQAIDQLAQDIVVKIFNKSASSTPQVLSKRPATTSDFGFTKSQIFRMALQAMDVGDVDGDGIDEIILGAASEIKVYKQEGDRLRLFFRLPLGARYKVHSIYVADLNGNSKSEIYASAIDVNEPLSFGGEWQGERFDYFFKDVRWHVRPMAIPDKKSILAGQLAAPDKPFRDGIYELIVADGTVQKGRQLEVPSPINLFDFSFADLDNDKSLEIITINQDDRLMVLKPNGKQLWKSQDHYGGSTCYVGGRNPLMGTKPGFATEETAEQEKIYLPTRIVVADVNGDANQDIIVNKNPPESSRAFQNLKKYSTAKIHALTWNGLGLVSIWEGDKIEGMVADYQLRMQENGKNKLYVGLVLNTDWLDRSSKAESVILTYPLDIN